MKEIENRSNNFCSSFYFHFIVILQLLKQNSILLHLYYAYTRVFLAKRFVSELRTCKKCIAAVVNKQLMIVKRYINACMCALCRWFKQKANLINSRASMFSNMVKQSY